MLFILFFTLFILSLLLYVFFCSVFASFPDSFFFMKQLCWNGVRNNIFRWVTFELILLNFDFVSSTDDPPVFASNLKNASGADRRFVNWKVGLSESTKPGTKLFVSFSFIFNKSDEKLKVKFGLNAFGRPSLFSLFSSFFLASFSLVSTLSDDFDLMLVFTSSVDDEVAVVVRIVSLGSLVPETAVAMQGSLITFVDLSGFALVTFADDSPPTRFSNRSFWLLSAAVPDDPVFEPRCELCSTTDCMIYKK